MFKHASANVQFFVKNVKLALNDVHNKAVRSTYKTFDYLRKSNDIVVKITKGTNPTFPTLLSYNIDFTLNYDAFQNGKATHKTLYAYLRHFIRDFETRSKYQEGSEVEGFYISSVRATISYPDFIQTFKGLDVDMPVMRSTKKLSNKMAITFSFDIDEVGTELEQGNSPWEDNITGPMNEYPEPDYDYGPTDDPYDVQDLSLTDREVDDIILPILTRVLTQAGYGDTVVDLQAQNFENEPGERPYTSATYELTFVGSVSTDAFEDTVGDMLESSFLRREILGHQVELRDLYEHEEGTYYAEFRIV